MLVTKKVCMYKYLKCILNSRMAYFFLQVSKDPFKTTAFSYRVRHHTVAKVVTEKSATIWDSLLTDLMPVP